MLVVACQAPPPSAISDADRAAIDALVSEYQTTALAGDWDAWSALWTENSVYMVPGVPVLEGREAITASLDAFPSPPSDLRVSLSAVERVGDLAWARGAFAMTMPSEGT